MPNVDSYLRIYRWQGLSDEALYLGNADPVKTERAVEQLAALATHDCTFNRNLPNEFVGMLRGYLRKEPGAIECFEDLDRRSFFLCDLLDYLTLFEKPRVKS